MSVEENRYSAGWSEVSESRVISPFRTASESLDDCEFRYTRSQEFNPGKIGYLEVTPLEVEDFAPEFLLRINKEEVEKISGRKADELEVHIVERDPSLRVRNKIKSWSLSEEIPERYPLPSSRFGKLSGANGLSFGIIISPKRGIEEREDLANSPGHYIAQKTFDLGFEPTSGKGFPTFFLDPENFEDDIDKGAVWYIEWLSREKLKDPTANAEDVLRIIFNKQCSQKLYRIQNNNAAGQVLWIEISVGIFLEIAMVVLGADVEEPSKTDTGFYPSILRTLEKATQKNFSDLKSDFTSNNPSMISQLRSSLHAFLKASAKIQSLKFGR
ncbi:hypothetical protein N8606_01565 [Akkermansiaceae bacterium]|nr:hypothetical protein [Akkermansiaceae bacterium]MDA8971865.1 hypothetical protein [bacterium]MDB4781135.1 hypothetical protein [Akkermansiaceae bacterium]